VRVVRISKHVVCVQLLQPSGGARRESLEHFPAPDTER
jgi:hypothetical protein